MIKNLIAALLILPFILVAVWLLAIVITIMGHPDDDSTFSG